MVEHSHIQRAAAAPQKKSHGHDHPQLTPLTTTHLVHSCDQAPEAIKEHEIGFFTGRKVAVDASMALYQFLIAIRSGDGGQQQQLTNEAGEVTSHIQGMFNRTIRMMTNGLKPCFVFDGKPPQLKSGELAKRTKKREEAEADLKAAEEAGNAEDVDKYNKRLTRVTKQHNADVKELLRLMGVPVVEAPSEAEGQCAELAKKGKVWGVATEDMDVLTFQTPYQLKKLTMAASRKEPIQLIEYQKILDGLEITKDQFIDLCVLCGCDYCDAVKGIGPKKALIGIKKYGTIEKFLASIDKDAKGITVPANWLTEEPIYVEARRIFNELEVIDGDTLDLKWEDCDEKGLRTFLIEKNGFDEKRVMSAIERLKKAKSKGGQTRMDSFFKVKPLSDTDKKKLSDKKRKAVADKKKAAAAAKKKKTKGAFGKK
jgi:flap endonuclease-1